MTTKKYPARNLTEAEQREVLALQPDDITMDKLKEYFANTSEGEARFQPNDRLVLPPNTLYNKKQERTTIGRYIYNRLVLTDTLGPLLGYQNRTMGKKGSRAVEGELSNLLLDDEITVAEFSEYIDKVQWLGFGIADFINPPLTSDLLMAPDRVKQRKEELLSDPDNAKAIEQGDITVMTQIEDELLDLSKQELHDLPDMDIYESGSRGSFNNNYKMTAISRGPVTSMSNPDQTTISTASLEDGIPAEEQSLYADIMAQASYSRSKETEVGG